MATKVNDGDVAIALGLMVLIAWIGYTQVDQKEEDILRHCQDALMDRGYTDSFKALELCVELTGATLD